MTARRKVSPSLAACLAYGGMVVLGGAVAVGSVFLFATIYSTLRHCGRAGRKGAGAAASRAAAG